MPGVSAALRAAVLQGVHAEAAEVPRAGRRRLARQSILAGLPLETLDRKLGDCLLVAVTEKRTKEEIDAFADALAKAVA